MLRPGIEPGSTAWKAAMLTTIPPKLHDLCTFGLKRQFLRLRNPVSYSLIWTLYIYVRP